MMNMITRSSFTRINAFIVIYATRLDSSDMKVDADVRAV